MVGKSGSAGYPNNKTESDALQEDRGAYLGYIRMVGQRRAEAKLMDYCWPDGLRSYPSAYEKKPLLRESV